MKRFLYFGAGIVFQEKLEAGNLDHEIVGILDNDPIKIGGDFLNYPVYAPDAVHSLEWDGIIITSMATLAIYEQLTQLGVPREKIHAPLLSQTNHEKWNCLKNCHAGETLYVVGNGPSLRIEDLDLLHEKRAICFAFNKIYLAFDLSPFRPDYFLVEDNLVMQNNCERLRELKGFTKFYPDNLVARLGPPDDETILFHIPYPKTENYQPGFSSKSLFLWPGYTVTYSAIQLAAWMGAARIVLIGVDFNFSAHSKTEQVLVGNGARDHFLPKYRPVGETWNTPRMELTEKAYMFALNHCDARGIEILNATRGGKLEVFPRVSLESVLGIE